uniref:LIM zinc-binding domain-containing protein n=1 Tax=Trichuris muris TaxID=70415 RepID=A0A5S6QMS3_TRIMR
MAEMAEKPAARMTSSAHQNSFLKCCAACKGQILGLHHYSDDQLADEEFYEVDGAHYCVICYQEMYALACCKCDSAITSRTCYSVLGMNYHFRCLQCKNCKRAIELDPVYLCQKAFLCKKCVMDPKASSRPLNLRDS